MRTSSRRRGRRLRVCAAYPCHNRRRRGPSKRTAHVAVVRVGTPSQCAGHGWHALLEDALLCVRMVLRLGQSPRRRMCARLCCASASWISRYCGACQLAPPMRCVTGTLCWEMRFGLGHAPAGARVRGVVRSCDARLAMSLPCTARARFVIKDVREFSPCRGGARAAAEAYGWARLMEGSGGHATYGLSLFSPCRGGAVRPLKPAGRPDSRGGSGGHATCGLPLL